MTAFRYRALDAAGKETAGVLEADTGKAARGLLRERGLFPLEVASVSQGGGARSARRRLKDADLTLLTRQWATLLASGLTVEQALAALIEQAETDATRQLLAGVRSEILAGYSLRAALDRYPQAFSTLYRASIAAGEKSGELARVMNQLADYLERSNALRTKTLQALLYPAIVAGVALMVIIGLMTYVVPQVVSVFQQSKQALPLLTRALIAASAVLRDWGWLMVLALIGAFAAGRVALREPHLKRRWDAWLLRLPVLGRHLRTLDATRFASTLSILAGSGVPLLAALDAGRQVIARLPLADAVATATERVREGQPLSRALGTSRQFPPLLIHMLANGEATGRVDELLDRAARLQQAELENRTAALTALLEPVLLLLMGGFVLLIVMAVMQPIIEINTLMK
ncbi:type II secretion system inner membrane protein GspF [Zoogloea sp.]|uniref:type II secretion system inner membrane protein GspF n=2 Tax=Zoogloea sp. TaxID=49181 RepID=UPI002BDF4050|nr:type II secretion system inner membrane protein GspF [Zoogloea sp.]HNH17882.1 type II secretion system inner membrane protein GspF [Zoogloea sp.]